MPDITFQNAIISLKAAIDIVKSINDLNSIAEIKTKTIELQNVILNVQNIALEAQSNESSMVQEIANLKQEIVKIKAWGREKQRYQLTTMYGGPVAYGLKESMRNSDPPHWICTKCYEDSKKSILTQIKQGRVDVFMCPVCQIEISLPGGVEPQYVKENT